MSEIDSKSFELPYFDTFLSELEGGKNSVLETLIGRNVHWGYWEDPAKATLTPAEFRAASDALTAKVLHWAQPKAGERILDVGCGFGGTIALLNETYEGLDLVGVNIDARQIERANAKVKPFAREKNQIAFHVGNACALPFPDGSFDTVLAVECIFHFPSKKKFFEEARRVLRPGGKLVLCDFVARPLLLPLIGLIYLASRKANVALYGDKVKLGTKMGYRGLARSTGFDVTGIEDITRNTIPTYAMLRKYAGEAGFDRKTFIRAHAVSEYGSKLGALRYQIYAFEKPR